MLVLNTHKLGIKKTKAKEISAGLAPIKTGKDPLPFEFYRLVIFAKGSFPILMFVQTCKKLYGKSASGPFGLCLLTLCWNLMCRVGNGVGVALAHISWTGDSLCVYFAHMKNDQTADVSTF